MFNPMIIRYLESSRHYTTALNRIKDFNAIFMYENLDKQITENVPEFFFIWDLITQKIIYLTHGHRDYAQGSLKEQSAYERMLDFVHPDHREKLEKMLHNLSADNAYQDHDLRVNDENYSAQWLNLRTFPIENEQGQISRIVAYISDVTDRKQQINALEELNEKNESLIRILAHDLKNPLNNMIMLSALAKKEFQKGAAAQGNTMLTMLEEASKNTSKLVESLLELLELRGSRFPLNLKKVDLIALVKNMVQYYVPQAEAYQIQLELQLPEKPVHVTLDAQKFRHVIDNLLSNALKFTPKAGRVIVKVEQNKEHVLLCISDTGIGIPQDKQKEIFQEFSRARQRGLHGEKSSGLGLSIAKKTVELHQGQIKVKSKQGEGSTFTIHLKS